MGLRKRDYEKIRLAVGVGSNDFSMERGSFKYKQKTNWKKGIKLSEVIQVDEQTDKLIFIGPGNDECFEVYIANEAGSVAKDNSKAGDVQRITMGIGSDSKEFPYNRFRLTVPCKEDEHFYGCGETYSVFDLKGEKIRIWVAEHQNAKRIAGKLIKQKIFGKHPNRTLPLKKYESYYAQPTFTSSAKYFMHMDVHEYSEIDFSVPGEITFTTQEPPQLTIGEADSFGKLSFIMSELLGRQKQLPDWIYDGAIIAAQDWTVNSEGTVSAGEGIKNIDRKLAAAKKTGSKICGVWSQDWCGCRCTKFGYQVMWNWVADDSKYENLSEHIKRWKNDGVRFLGYINPFIALEKELYREAKEKGYCVKNKNGEDYLVTITTFPAAMVDLTNPDAYEWYKNIIKTNMIGIGMGGWMADFGEYLPVDAVLHSGESVEGLHNRWPAIWAKLNREAIEECGKEDEVFFFTRAGHTATIGNSAMMWTGDQHVDWSVDDGLISVVPATLSLAMSGYGITHSDVGGYTTIMQMTRTKELLLRWEEMNAFTPLYRFHEGNQPSRNAQFDDDEEMLKQIAVFSLIHAKLKPYLKELVKEQESMGTPVMRPLFYHYDEEACYVEKTEYLLGEDILVAPVFKEGATGREVYLPADEWIHLFSGKTYGEGTCYVAAPIGCPPVFVRKNSSRKDMLLDIVADR